MVGEFLRKMRKISFLADQIGKTEMDMRVSMGLTVRRKTAKNLAVRRKNERILAVSRKKN